MKRKEFDFRFPALGQKKRRKKFDFQIECIRLLDKTRGLGPLSRKEIAQTLSETFAKTIIPGSSRLKRALNNLRKKGVVVDSGNPRKPREHFFISVPQTYSLSSIPVESQRVNRTLEEKISIPVEDSEEKTN